ncbi:MAG: VOC family protein [Sciscionella sp.]
MLNPLNGIEFFHVGVGVPDLDKALHELGAALGLSWSPVFESRMHEWPLRIALSKQGPPYYEVIEAPVGSPWCPRDGENMVHFGFWSDDVPLDRDRLLALGFQVEVDGVPLGYQFVYLRGPCGGLRIELSGTQGPSLWRTHERMLGKRN